MFQNRMSDPETPLLKALREGVNSVREFWVPDVDDERRNKSCDRNPCTCFSTRKRTLERVDASTLTPLQFYREYVATNKPVILTNAVNHWPALKLWKGKAGIARLIALASTSPSSSPSTIHPPSSSSSTSCTLQCTCTFTPNGRADALTYIDSKELSGKPLFIMPHEESLPFHVVLNRLLTTTTTPCTFSCTSSTTPTTPSVPCGFAYLSVQNDNLRTQLHSLLQDLQPTTSAYLSNTTTTQATPATVDAATSSFGSDPDAINIWMGTAGNTSSTHKDHYENLYSVIAGVKRFILMPPTDILWLYERPCETARYVHKMDKCVCHMQQQHDEGEKNSSLFDPSNSLKPVSLPSCWGVKTLTTSEDEEDDDEGTAATTELASAKTNETKSKISKTPWITVDPSLPCDVLSKEFPLFKHATPVIVDLHAGETLYLPSLWYHQVSHPNTQDDGNRGSGVGQTDDDDDTNEGTGVTIAVNSWFDMNYMSSHWAQYQMMTQLATLTTRSADAK